PRPHDTGMVTLISQNLNEFELHLRAILGLPIPQIEIFSPAASAVILAEKNSERIEFNNVAAALTEIGTDLRLFGKPNSRPYRRMGVALATAETTELARQKALKVASTVALN
ncbi:MAG: phosphoribosylglycinamide formyltransferase 2, partial [Cyanobacteria bacterium J06629_2]